MKNLVVIIATVCLSTTVFAAGTKVTTAETSIASSKTWLVQTSAFGLLAGSFNVMAGKAINENSTVNGMFATSSYSSNATSASGYSLGAQYSYWLSGNNVFTDSWTADASFQYATARSSAGSTAAGFALTGMANYNWFWTNGMSVNAGLGLSYITLDLSSIGLTRVSGILPAFGVNVGYAF